MNIAIGTAQFGLNYGESPDPTKKVPLTEVAKIISLASLADCKVLDTASLYGDACDALGSMGERIAKIGMKVVYKMPPIEGDIGLHSLEKLKKIILADLKTMNVTEVYCLMVHNAQDLIRPGSYFLFDVLQELKRKGVCRKIGVSVYNPEEIIRISSEYPIDLVQVPGNLVDQRFDASLIRSLKTIGQMEVHVRSIFLRGLLLMPIEKIEPQHDQVKDMLSWLNDLDIEPIDACLDYARQLEADQLVIGFHSAEQLNDILIRYQYLKEMRDYSPFAIHDEKVINPSSWS